MKEARDSDLEYALLALSRECLKTQAGNDLFA